MRRRRTALLALVAGIAAAVIGAIAVPTAWAEDNAKANDRPGFLQVYDANVENLPTADFQCAGDWKDLVYYMRSQPYKPDAYLVQQISGAKQLKSLTAYLSRQLGETYKGVIAEASPKHMGSPCGKDKAYQTNAVIYRADRLHLVRHTVWQVKADKGSGCVANTQARTRAVMGLFEDKVAKKRVAIVSNHWATGKSGGTPCAKQNAAQLKEKLAAPAYRAALVVAGGDFNIADRAGGAWRGWYTSMNKTLGGKNGLRDVAYAACQGGGKVVSCLKDDWTIGGDKRIDFLFAGRGDGTLPKASAVHTIAFDQGDAADRRFTGGDRGDLSYSQHRAIRARIHY